MSKAYYIGVMSGTSLDGVDVVLCQIDDKACILVESLEYPIPKSLKEDILKMIENSVSLNEVGQMHIRLGQLFCEAIELFLQKYQLRELDIRAIGLHGQTLWHAPLEEYAFSMQLGDAYSISARLNIPVVSDFRQKDIVLGGQGAPFAPAFHAFLFKEEQGNVAVVNIGGMANITILDKKLIGYDTGCGNVLLDFWMAKHKKQPYDKNGLWAKEGEVSKSLLEAFLEDEYFQLSAPKSTGREKFNEIWLNSFLEKYDVCVEDVQRTLLELTVLTITNEVLKFNRDKIILCGGGAKNGFLVARMKALLPHVKIMIAKESDAIEAMTFAWLAYMRMGKKEVNLKAITGASKNTILGGIYE